MCVCDCVPSQVKRTAEKAVSVIILVVLNIEFMKHITHCLC